MVLGWRSSISLPQTRLDANWYGFLRGSCLALTSPTRESESYSTVLIGGWWTRPANWKANTAIVATAMGLMTYAVWNFSAEREVCSLILH